MGEAGVLTGAMGCWVANGMNKATVKPRWSLEFHLGEVGNHGAGNSSELRMLGPRKMRQAAVCVGGWWQQESVWDVGA